jgi:MFS family permease
VHVDLAPYLFGHALEQVGIWAAVSALALALGPVLGGLISQHLHWGWIFLINVPLGVITFVLAVLYVAESRAEAAARRLDLPGRPPRPSRCSR